MIIREFKFSRRNIGLFLDELENRLFWFGYETSLGSRSRVTYVIMHSKLFYVWCVNILPFWEVGSVVTGSRRRGDLG